MSSAASGSTRTRMASACAPAEAPAPPRPTPPERAAAHAGGSRCVRRRSSSSTRRGSADLSSLEHATQPIEAARDPARDRAAGDREFLADRRIALVTSEEAVEHLSAVGGELRQRLPHVESLVQLRHVVVGGVEEWLDFLRTLPSESAQAVDAQPAGELREPRTNGGVVAEPVEPLVGAREDLLEDVPRVLPREPECLARDRVHVARDPLHELPPCLVLPGSAAGHERSVRYGICHPCAPYNCVSERHRGAALLTEVRRSSRVELRPGPR